MPQSSGLVHESAYYRVEVFSTQRVVRVTRLARPFETPGVIDQACEPVQLTLDKTGRRTHRLLIDTRDAIGNNQPGFEAAFAAHRRRMLVGFPRVAFLVKSAIGKLHVERLLTEAGDHHARVFFEEVLAMHYLTEDQRT